MMHVTNISHDSKTKESKKNDSSVSQYPELPCFKKKIQNFQV